MYALADASLTNGKVTESIARLAEGRHEDSVRGVRPLAE